MLIKEGIFTLENCIEFKLEQSLNILSIVVTDEKSKFTEKVSKPIHLLNIYSIFSTDEVSNE
jgi:hypothetical protein